MNRTTTMAGLAALGFAAAGAFAQPYAIDWYTIDGGGGTSSGGTFTLSGTIGQHDAGTVMTGGSFTLTGGFWVGAGGGPVGCDTIDFNGDGLFPDNQDLEDFLSVFGGGPCSTGTCGDIDFNNDQLFPDNTDLEAFFNVFGGGPCL
ncbi:MAG TPA: hypothetical protein VD971_08875 [Phycisphaerales bacterium]|nr:hypothetical protein [Phycisphaerales bacterium]